MKTAKGAAADINAANNEDVDRGSIPNGGDPVGDSQVDYSGWGGLEECSAIEGGRILTMQLDGPHRQAAPWRRLLTRLHLAH